MAGLRLRRDGEHLALQTPRFDQVAYRTRWVTFVLLNPVEAANLAAELGAWLAGTDGLPDLEEPRP